MVRRSRRVQKSMGYSNSVLTQWGFSMKLFKLQVLSLFKLHFSISGENRSLNEHLRAKFGLNGAVKLPKPKNRSLNKSNIGAKINP